MYQELKTMIDLLVDPGFSPNKPKLSSDTPSQEEIKEYNAKVENYPLELDQYAKLQKKYYDDIDIIYEFIKNEGGLYVIPEKYQDKVWSMSLEKGSYNFYEIYQELDRLCEAFMID